ncbi:hypothetical protein B6V00_05405 [ANME-1 cluster archaeon ex4572_4]|nr:MAG: hypothetical protein B6V00_05405 [ANME-1 cluster archaeon ex4572_4]
MVSVFLEAVPANLLAARAVCEDPENRANNATHTHFGMLIRVKADKRLVVRRSVLEDAIGRGLTENEWQSVTWNFIGKIAKSESKSKSERRDEQDEFVFEDLRFQEGILFSVNMPFLKSISTLKFRR